MKMSLVVAVAENGVIGRDGAMPWRLSTDLKRFKEITLGKPMVMGRKTFESIGKALPGRTSIVITRQKDWQSPGVVPVNSLEAALVLAQEIAVTSQVDEFCVIGGGDIFRQAMDKADILYLTRVHSEPEGDAYFPDVDAQKWEEVSRTEFPAGEKDSVATTYIVYHRTV